MLDIFKPRKSRKKEQKRMKRLAIMRHKTEVAWTEYCLKRKGKPQSTSGAYYHDLKKKVLAGYGKICNCCSETILELLTIDHVYEDGKTERSRGLHSRKLLIHILQNNFPKKYQILCISCNVAKSRYGICPHNWPIYRQDTQNNAL